ncbi:MAG TPA: CaiB/BaiF CoA-transferase family protein [Candidatus Dormibacteraeota bacterium]|nr:CaiB/BaiF CoA-transferase family protein [Candidatus Dormibacteraeota bacterium]
MAPLTGVRVVALEQAVSGPLCTQHLADLGADVIKLERPGEGDFARRYDSVVKGQSAYFVWLNRGKRSVELDLKSSSGARVMHALLARADVFVHNLGPGAVDRLGLGWVEIHSRWPSLISCAISGYGMDGPYRERKAYDLLLQGEAGVLAVTGTPEQPAKVGVSIADICAGMYSFSSILAALYERTRTGEGKLIDISMLECLAAWMMPPLYHQIYSGHAPLREGMRHNMIAPYGPYPARDGLVNLAVQNESQWVRLCEGVLDRPELARDPRFISNELRVRNRHELEPIIEQTLARWTAAEVEARLARADVPYGHVNTVAELAAHPQLTARGRWLDVDSEAGPVKVLADPFNIGGMAHLLGAVPRVGQHTAEVLEELA